MKIVVVLLETRPGKDDVRRYTREVGRDATAQQQLLLAEYVLEKAGIKDLTYEQGRFGTITFRAPAERVTRSDDYRRFTGAVHDGISEIIGL